MLLSEQTWPKVSEDSCSDTLPRSAKVWWEKSADRLGDRQLFGKIEEFDLLVCS